MSSQSKIIKDILSTYDTILENKKISEATDVYDNVDFKDNIVKNSTPSRDNINTILLQDIQTAAKNAGVKVDITTAISGHESLPSRHPSVNAVDISQINGKKVSLSNRTDADKLVAELVKMGYVKNSESGNPKAVLTFGFKNHDDHVHISNTSGSSSSGSSSSGKTSSSTTTGNSDYNIYRNMGNALLTTKVGKSLVDAAGLTEEKVYSSFGKDYIIRSGEVIIPKDNNKKIKSPVSGVITTFLYNSNCSNQLFIKFKVDNNDFYLEYCGLKSISVRRGETINQGDVIGTSDDDIRVTLYGSNGNKKYIDPKLESNEKKSGNNNYDNKDLNNGFYTSVYRKVKNAFKSDEELKNLKKVQENINRIKGLL